MDDWHDCKTCAPGYELNSYYYRPEKKYISSKVLSSDYMRNKNRKVCIRQESNIALRSGMTMVSWHIFVGEWHHEGLSRKNDFLEL